MMMAIVFTIVFGRFARLPSDGVPYIPFVFCALLPWNYFARSLGDASDSLVGASNLVTKVYFPRLVLPLSKVFAGLVDLLAASLVMGVVLCYYGITPTVGVTLLPLFLLALVLSALGAGLWLTALNVRYRDVKFIVPFLSQLWLFASPIAYSTSLVPREWWWVYGLNPVAWVIDGFRWALLGSLPPAPELVLPGVSVMLLMFVSGLLYFKRMERTFADLI
jgi:lipopolysaccharide transport system permease protein